MAKTHVSVAERFVGRAHELQQLEAAIAAARAGRGSVAVVSGPAGIGKTGLVEELARRTRRHDGMAFVTERGWASASAPAFWPWPAILHDLRARSDAGFDDLAGDPFAVCTAVGNRVAEACATSPLCLIVDDADRATEDALVVLDYVTRLSARLPLLLVLCRRVAGPLDEIERDATPIVLHGLSAEETAALLADIPPEMARVIQRLTGGNPRTLRRLSASATGASDMIHAAVCQAADALPPETRRILQVGAVLGATVPVALAAAVARSDPAAVLDAVAAGERVGLVGGDGTDRFAYGHEMVRSCLEESLDGGERLDAHARAASSLTAEGPLPPGQFTRRARHAMAAAPCSAADTRLAVNACEIAAEALVADLRYGEADELLSAAVALHDASTLGPTPATLLVRWAQAALRLGRMVDARERFDRSATAAQNGTDPVLFAEAALGLGGHGVYEHRNKVERERVLGLQRSALARLPEDPRYQALRSRLVARLAAEDTVHTGPTLPVFAAVEAARASGDPVALAEALSMCHQILLTPEHVPAALQVAEELVRVAAEANDGALGLMGLWCQTIDLFHLGDPCALPCLAAVRQRAEALGSQQMLANVALADVMLLIRAGRLEEAEAAAHRCYERGQQLGEVNALNYLGAHLLGIRWMQGRDAELVDLAEEVATSPTVVEADFSFHACAAAILARAGQPARAHAWVGERLSQGLGQLPQTSTWLVGMMGVVDLAATLGDAVLAREAYDVLLPYRGFPMLGGSAMLCLGSTERGLGIAARTFGDHDLAVDHLERAIEGNRRLGHLPLVAIAQADLAHTLVARDRDGAAGDDRSPAVSLLQSAVAEADRLSLPVSATTWRADLQSLDDAGRRPDRHASLHRDGSRWVVTLDGQRVRIPDLVGMRYLAELLARPGQQIPALTLASSGAAPPESARHEVLDDAARDAYASRAQELSADLAEAEAHNDLARAEQLREEIDTLVDQLEAAVGINGRPRLFTANTERARTAVRKAIKRAIDVIDDASPTIADVLRNSIRTGTVCSYDGRDGLRWSTSPSPG